MLNREISAPSLNSEFLVQFIWKQFSHTKKENVTIFSKNESLWWN